MQEPFWIEVGRMAHELSERHGVSAFSFAEQQAQSARATGETDEHMFWEAVAAALRPR
jgi:hypothetical protein